MKKTLKLSVFFALIVLAGCKKEETKSDQASQPSMINRPNSSGDNRFDLVGHGYDVTGEFASINSARLKVIDVEKLFAAYPNRVDFSKGALQYSLVEGLN